MSVTVISYCSCFYTSNPNNMIHNSINKFIYSIVTSQTRFCTLHISLNLTSYSIHTVVFEDILYLVRSTVVLIISQYVALQDII